MPVKVAIREHLHKVAAGDATDVLEYPAGQGVEPKDRLHLTLISWEDVTTNWTQTRLYVERSGVKFRVKDDASVTAATVVLLDDEIVLSRGEKLCVYFSGATSGDLLHVWLQGYGVIE